MKKLIALITLLGGAVGTNAQSIIWGDYIGTFGITVYAPNPANPTVEQTGNTSYDRDSNSPGATTPGANMTYGGIPLGGSATGSGSAAYGNGDLFTISLYAAPGIGNSTGLTASIKGGSANAVASALFDNNGGTGVANAGVNGDDSAGAWLGSVDSSASKVPFPFTGSATLGLVAWYNGNGSLSNPTYTYLNSLQSGASPIESVSTIGGIGSPPSTVYELNQEVVSGNLQSFSLMEVPEANTIALGVMGASALLFYRRK